MGIIRWASDHHHQLGPHHREELLASLGPHCGLGKRGVPREGPWHKSQVAGKATVCEGS